MLKNKDMKVVKVIGALVLGAVLSVGVTSQAIPVSGMIAFKGTASVSSTGVNYWNNTEVAGVLGFGGLVSTGDDVTMAAPLAFNNSSPVNSLWSVGNFTFNLTSSAVIFQGIGAVLVSGTGTISGNGFDTTYGTWTLYTKIPKFTDAITTPIFSFTLPGCSVQTTDDSTGGGTRVPDGGTTLILLGLALSAVAILRQIMRKGIA
jgi:hypothetical protein